MPYDIYYQTLCNKIIARHILSCRVGGFSLLAKLHIGVCPSG